jgi:hypothetical protein
MGSAPEVGEVIRPRNSRTIDAHAPLPLRPRAVGGLVCRDVGGALTAIPVAYYAFMVIVGFIIIAWEKFQR